MAYHAAVVSRRGAVGPLCVAEEPDEERAIGDISRKSVSVQTKLDPPRPSDEGRVFEAEGIDSFSFFEVFEVFEVFEKLRGSAAFLWTAFQMQGHT